MEIVNHKEEVPLAHYQTRFQASDSREIRERLPSAPFDGEAFSLTLLGKEYLISWPAGTVTARDGSEPPLPAQTLLLRSPPGGKDVPRARGRRPARGPSRRRRFPW